MADFYYKEFNSGSFAQMSRRERNVYNPLLCSKTYFEGQHLDGDIITNFGAEKISEDGRVIVLPSHNRLQIIIFSEPLCLIWFGIPMKKYLSWYFIIWTDGEYQKLVCRIFLQSILLRKRSE